jgi:hypothetical protein
VQVIVWPVLLINVFPDNTLPATAVPAGVTLLSRVVSIFAINSPNVSSVEADTPAD